jgi:methyltransferase (TIGR00027 family)
MKSDQPSRTAWRVAVRRAVHQVLDRPVVFSDPLAGRLIGAASDEALLASVGERESTNASRALRAFIAVRSRFAEDRLAQAVAAGVDRYIVLGAGLDTFGCRDSWPAGLREVIEIDHPATQAWKRERLLAAGVTMPAALRLLPVNFESQTLAEALREASIPLDRPAFVSWLGVTPYLDRAAVDATLRDVASLPAGTGLAFDYAVDPVTLPPVLRAAFDALARRVEAAGEPFRTFFDPPQLAADLRAFGFTRVEDLDGVAINARYFGGRADGLHVGEAGHLAYASV